MDTIKIKEAIKCISEAKSGGMHGYKIMGVDCGATFEEFDVFPRAINKNGDEYEFVYAIYEIMEEVLALKVGESMYFQPIRDDHSSKGIIIRLF